MVEQLVTDKPKTSSLSHQLLPVFALRKLAGFADETVFVDSAHSQTRDGFSFDVLGKSLLQSAYSANIPVQKYRDGQNRQSETSVRHLELVSGSTSNNRTALGSEIGTRYRYIDDTPLVPLSEAGTSSATSNSTSKTRSRPNSEYVLYSYGEPVGMTNDGGTSYFGTDILGSVRSVTDKYGAVQADYSYDAFGSPYLGNLENDIGFGYCGKVYDIGTGLYDYGFRDYSPVSARFTTVDPIRDGSNWFSYVVNDPVNYCDPLGLTASDAGNKKTLVGFWTDKKNAISDWLIDKKNELVDKKTQMTTGIKNSKLGQYVKDRISEVTNYQMINNTDAPFYSFPENDKDSNNSDGGINLETGQGYKISDGWSVTITSTGEIDKNGNPVYKYEPNNEVPKNHPILRAIAEKEFELKTYDSYEEWEKSGEAGWLQKQSFQDAKKTYDSSKKN